MDAVGKSKRKKKFSKAVDKQNPLVYTEGALKGEGQTSTTEFGYRNPHVIKSGGYHNG